MKTSLIAIAGATMLALGIFALSANAGSVTDTDGDGAPDPFDNCPNVSNGPLTPPPPPSFCDQNVDTDGDGFGNACDADFDQDNIVAGTDFTQLLTAFGTASALEDLDCDGVVAGTDFTTLLTNFGNAPG